MFCRISHLTSLLVCIVFISVLPGSSLAQELLSASATFNPTDDAYVQSSSPTSNFGTQTVLRLRKVSTETSNSYLKFNVTGLSGSIQSAKLRLYVSNDGPDGGSVYSVSNNYQNTTTPWTQTGLNWNNAPAISDTVLSSAGAVVVGQWVELNVTSAIAGNRIYSFGLKNNLADPVTYGSNEAANKPELVIVVSGGQQLPKIAVGTTPDSFGRVLIGNSSSWSIPISNVGTADLTVSSISNPGGDFTLSNVPSLPLVLGADQAVYFSVAFSPKIEGQATGSIMIASNDPSRQIVTITLSGEGAVVKPALPGVIYASTGSGQLITINPATGAGTLVGSMGVAIRSLTMNSEGYLYGADDRDLYKIDAVTGMALFVARMNLPYSIVDIVFDSNNFLYGCQENKFYKIDQSSGSATVVGSTANLEFHGLAFDPTMATLWGYAEAAGGSYRTYTIDPTTGDVTLVGNLPFAPWDICFDNSGNLYGVKYGTSDSFDFVSINKSSGNATVIGRVGFGVTDLASAPGHPIVPQMNVLPKSVGLSKQIGNTSAPQTITIRSIGTDALIITEISNPGAPFTISGLPALPLHLAPRETISFQVSFTPTTVGSVTAAINITGNDADSPTMIVSLFGVGYASEPSGAALYVVQSALNQIAKLDPFTGGILHTIPTPVPSSTNAGLAFDGRSLFFSPGLESNNRIYELDPATGAVRNSFPRQAVGLGHSGVSLFAHYYSESFYELDPTTGAEIRNFYPYNPKAEYDNFLGALSFGGSNGTVFGIEDRYNNYKTAVQQYNPANGLQVASGPHFSDHNAFTGLGYSNKLNQLFAALGNTIRIYDYSSGQALEVGSFNVPGSPTGLAADEYDCLSEGSLFVCPSLYNFGRLLPGNTASPQIVTLRNVGNDPLTVTRISGVGAAFTLSGLPSLPVEIAPGGFVKFSVGFSSASAGNFESTMIITTNDQEHLTAEVLLKGEVMTPPAPGTLFATTGSQGQLITINPATGAGATIGSTGDQFYPLEIEFHENGTLYSAGSSFLTIDIFDGTPHFINAWEDVVYRGLEFDASGKLYASYFVQGFGSTSAELETINLQTGATKWIGEIGFRNVKGLAFGPDGTLYSTSDGKLISINTATGAGTVIGPTGFANVTALEFGPDGVLYAGVVQDCKGLLIAINPSTGAGTLVGATGFSEITGLSFFPVGTAPYISSFTPTSGPIGTEVTINGANLTGATSVKFNGVAAASFIVDSANRIRATVPAGATSGAISITTPVGTAVSPGSFLVTGGTTIVFTPTNDAYVRSSTPTTNYGTLTALKLRKSGSETLNTYLKFAVTGITGLVQSAKLRIYVTDASPDGGSVYAVPNNYLGTSTPWVQSGLNWNNAPAITGGAGTPVLLGSAGAVSVGQWVELNVTSAITRNGTFSFGMKNNNSDAVTYSSKEGSNKPELIIVTAPDQTVPVLWIKDTSVTEGNSGTVNAEFTLSLTAPISKTVTVNVATTDGTALAGSDYQALVPTSISFPPMTQVQTVKVVVYGDLLDEPNETFSVILTDATNAVISDSQGIGTIIDDDAPGAEAAFVFHPAEDSYVQSSNPTANFGTRTFLRQRQSSSESLNTYLKFKVAGLKGSVLSVRLRLYVTKESTNGGSVHPVSNNYQGTSTPWTQSGLNWSNAPAISGVALGSVGAVTLNTWVEFDVTAAIAGNGVYSFGMKGGVSNFADYSSKEGSNKPELVIQTSGSSLASISEDATFTEETLPEQFSLSPNYPNPFNAGTTIAYALPQEGNVRLVIYNMLGQMVRKLVDENQTAGHKRILWDDNNEFGTRVSSGVYFYRIEFGRQRLIGKMILQQ